MKIFNIVENLDKGAVENWLVNVFIESKKIRPEWDWTFYCILGKEGRLDETVRRAGGKIIYSPVTVSNKLAFLKNLRKTLKGGNYDILHSHHDYLSGFYLLASSGIKFRKRLLHVHNTDKSLPVGNRMLHRLLLNPFKRSAIHFSDVIVGISEDTLAEFAEGNKPNNSKYAILYYGVDFSRFEIEADTDRIRKEFDLPLNSRILLFAGRMNDLKNPEFVVEVLSHILKKDENIYAVFIGAGDRTAVVQKKAEEHGVTNNIRIAGWHDNVPLVMKSSHVFVFPRKKYPREGLGLVVVEAQAAGLPVFITPGIVKDAIVIEELAYFNDPDNPHKWAEQILTVLNDPPVISQKQALEKMKQSRFDLKNATKNFVDLYER